MWTLIYMYVLTIYSNQKAVSFVKENDKNREFYCTYMYIYVMYM